MERVSQGVLVAVVVIFQITIIATSLVVWWTRVVVVTGEGIQCLRAQETVTVMVTAPMD
jgi:hypothetical protein